MSQKRSTNTKRKVQNKLKAGDDEKPTTTTTTTTTATNHTPITTNTFAATSHYAPTPREVYLFLYPVPKDENFIPTISSCGNAGGRGGDFASTSFKRMSTPGCYVANTTIVGACTIKWCEKCKREEKIEQNLNIFCMITDEKKSSFFNYKKWIEYLNRERENDKNRFLKFFFEIATARVGGATGVKAIIETCFVGAILEKADSTELVSNWENEVRKVCSNFYPNCTPFLLTGIIQIYRNTDYSSSSYSYSDTKFDNTAFLHFLHELAPVLEEASIISIFLFLEQKLPPEYRPIFNCLIRDDDKDEKGAISTIQKNNFKVKDFPQEPEVLKNRVKRLFYNSYITVGEFREHDCNDDEIWEILKKRFCEPGCTYPTGKEALTELQDFLVSVAEKQNSSEVLETVLNSSFFTRTTVDRHHEILFSLAACPLRLSPSLQDKLSNVIKESYRCYKATKVEYVRQLLDYFYYCATEWARVFTACPKLLRSVIEVLPHGSVGCSEVLQKALAYRLKAVLYENRENNQTPLKGELWREESRCVIDIMKRMDVKEEFIDQVLIKDQRISHPEIISEILVQPIANDLKKSIRDYSNAPDSRRNLELATIVFPRGDVCNFLVNEAAFKLVESGMRTLRRSELAQFESEEKQIIEVKDHEMRQQLDDLLYRSTKKTLTVKQFRCIDNNKIIFKGLRQLAEYCNKTEEFQRMDQDRLQIIKKLGELRKVSEVARKVANQLEAMRVLPQVEDRIRRLLTAEQEKEDSLTLEEVEKLHRTHTSKTFSLEVDGICPGYKSNILQYFELKSVDATETTVIPSADANITELIDTFTAFYKECVVVPFKKFWERLSDRTITAAELSDVFNIKAFEDDVKNLAEEEERETYERRVDTVQNDFITRFDEEMRHFSTAFKIPHQEAIRNGLKSFLDFCINYKNFEAFGKLANSVNVEMDVNFSPILMKCYSDCETSLQEIAKIIDHTRAAFPLVFRTPSCYTRRLLYCMTHGFPETLNKFLDDSDYKKKKFENTSIVGIINDKIAEEDGETVQLLLDFRKVVQTMFTASRDVLAGLSQCRVQDAMKLQKFLCESAPCDIILKRIESRFLEISAMHGRQEVESSKAEATRVIEKGQFVVAEENGVITFFANVKFEGGLSKYSEDRLEEWTAQFICSQTQSEALEDEGKRSNSRIFYTFPVVIALFRKVRDTLEELRSTGHPLVNDLPKEFPGNISSKKLEEIIDMLQLNLNKWRSIVDSARANHSLLYLCPRPLLQRLYMAMNNIRTTPLTPRDLAALHEATLQPEKKEFPKDPNADARECLRKHGDDTMGAVADLVFNNFNREAFTSAAASFSRQVVYCVESHEMELPSNEVLLYVVSLFWHQYSRLPLPVEILVCTPQTTTLEIEDFIGCWFTWVRHAQTWCPHGDSPYFCIVNAQLLSRPVQDALVQRVVRYGAKDINDNRPMLAIFASKQSSISLQLRQADPVKKETQSIKYREYVEKVRKALQDELSDTVLVVSSKQPSCGKTRYIKELAHSKKIRMATVPIQRDTTTETVLTRLRDIYTERENIGEKILIHFDISAFADVTLVNEVLFYLFVLRRFVSRRGDTLHPVLTDLLTVELPNDGNFGENAMEVVPMLALLSSEEVTGTQFDVKKIEMKADGVVIPVPAGVKKLTELAKHFNCTLEELMETNPGVTATTELDPSTLIVPPRIDSMTLIELSTRLNVSADDIMKVNAYIPNKEFVVHPGACNGLLATPCITEARYLSFGSKCLVHYHRQHTANNRLLSHGAAIENLPIPSSVEISAAIDTLFPKATTKLSRYVAYSAVCTQLTFAFGNHDSLYYNQIDQYYNKLEYYITKLIIQTVQNMCASAIPPRNDKNETEASRFARTPSFSEWRSHPFALFSDDGNFSLLTLGADTSVLLEITHDDPNAEFKHFIKISDNLFRSLNRRALEDLCLQLEGPLLNIDALKYILPLICMNDRVHKVLLALSSLPDKSQTMPLKEVDNDAVKWLIDFLTVENKRLVENSMSGGELTVGGAISIIKKWLMTLFIHPGGSNNIPPYLLTPDLLVRKVALKMRMVAGIPAVVSGDQGCGKTLMCEAFARCSGCPYYVLYCNGSVTPSNLRMQMTKAIERAKRSPNTSVIVQLDEGNCLFDNWTLHQVMCDRVVDGLFIPSNILFVAMLNPTKRRTAEQQARFDQINTMGGMDYVSFNKDTQVKTTSDTTELVYDVSPTPESVLGLGFDFGSAASTFSSTRTYNGEQRMAKYIPLSFDKWDEVSDEMRFASSEVQFMIDFLFEPYCKVLLSGAFDANGDKGGKHTFWPAYRNILVTCLRAMQYCLRVTFKGEESVVSLRDIRKVCKLVPFVMRCFLVRYELEEKEGDPTHDEVFGFLTKATICALIMTYYLRLDEDARQKVLDHIFVAWKTARNASKNLPPKFCELPATSQELYGYFDFIAGYATKSLTKENDGADLAMVTALKENAFLIIVCAKLKMDLFIVGCAGSSKSRALSSVLAASEARCPFFDKIDFDLHPLVLQCTHHTTPGDVNRLAYNAAKVQFDAKDKCVVLVLEEVGATSKSKHNPLMTLHNIIDHGVDIGEEKTQPICVIGISNWWLAGAKMGRCNVVHRGLPNVEDLKEIGKMLLMGTEACWLNDFCEAVRTQVLNNQIPEAKVLGRFFGMRDYYNSIKLLKLLLTKMTARGGRRSINVDINCIERYPHIIRWAMTISYGGLPPTTENMKMEYALYRRLMNSFSSVFENNVVATYSWTDNPDSLNGRGIPLCAACAEMMFQRKWLTYVNNLPPKMTMQEREEARMRLFRKHAKEQDSPKCEGFYEENTEVPPSAVHAVDIAAFTILHSETRHLMVFGDPGAVVGLLRLHGLLPNKGPYAAGVIFAAEATERRLPDQLRIVKEVMARGGHLVIQGLGLSALLLEPANMHYIKRGDGENSFRTRLPMADGSSKLVPCHPDFRITMIVSEEEAARAPPPVVQRFTKVTLSYLSSMSGMQRETMRRIKEEAKIEWRNKTASLLDLLIPGFSDESLAMLIMSVSIRRMALQQNKNEDDEAEAEAEEGEEQEEEEEEEDEEDGYTAELNEIRVRLALSFSPDAWTRVMYSPESENNKDVILQWKTYFEDSLASSSRNHFLREELEDVKNQFYFAPHILLLTRQPDPSVHYIQQSVKEILELSLQETDNGEDNSNDILYTATVYGNESNSLNKFTSELERLRDRLIKASSANTDTDNPPTGLLIVLLDLTSASSAEDLWATFRSSTEQVVTSDEWMLHVIVVATVGDSLLAARTGKELPRLHYTNDWIVLHVDEISPTVMTDIHLRDIETKSLLELCDAAFDAVSEDPESLLVLAQQLSHYAGGELKSTNSINEWIYTLNAFLKTDLGKAYINRVKKCVKETAENNDFDWKRPALRQQRETLRSTYVRYLMHVVQLALLPGLCYISGSMKTVTNSNVQNADWYKIVEDNVELFFEVPGSFIRCFDYCLQPDELLPEHKGHLFENKLPFSTRIIQLLRKTIHNCSDPTNMETLLTDVREQLPFYEQLSDTHRELLYYDTVATVSPPGATFTTPRASQNSREILSFFDISSKISNTENTEWTRPPKGNEALTALVLVERFPTDFIYLVTLSNSIVQRLQFIKKRIAISVNDIIHEGKSNALLSLENVIAIKALAYGFQNNEPINWDWLESLAVAEKSGSRRFLSQLDSLYLRGLDEETLPPELLECIETPELKPVRLMLCKELQRDLNKPKQREAWFMFGLNSEKLENNLRYFLVRPWLQDMLFEGRSTSDKVRDVKETDSLTEFMTQATYRELEKCEPPVIVKAIEIQSSKFPSALRTAMCLGVILAALNYVAKNVEATDATIVNALNKVLCPFRLVNREWLILFALRQGTSGGVELGGLLALAQYLKEMTVFKDSEYLTTLIKKLENDKKAQKLLKLLDLQLLSNVVSSAHLLFETAEPNSIAGWYQVQIKEGKIQDTPLPGITTSLEYDLLIGDTVNSYIYSCPNGHKYATNACNHINSQSTCLTCGEKIGGPKYGQLHPGNKLLGTRKDFEGKVHEFTPTTGFVVSFTNGIVRGTRELTSLQIAILSTLSLSAVTNPNPENVNKAQLENNLLTLLREASKEEVFSSAENPTEAAAEFLIELFTDGASFFTTARGATSRDTIETLCKNNLKNVESCRTLAAAAKADTVNIISLIRDDSEAQAVMKKVMEEHREFLYHTPLHLLRYRFLPTAKRLLESAVLRDERLKTLDIASRSITVENADDLHQLVRFAREFEEVCERTPELKNGTVNDAEELRTLVLRTTPVFQRMFRLVERLGCIQLDSYNFIQELLDARNFDYCRTEYFLVGQQDKMFIEGLYGGYADDRSSFALAQNTLIKALLPDRFPKATNENVNERLIKPEERPVAIRGAMDLLRVNLSEVMLRVLEEYHTDLIQLCPTLDQDAIDCYIIHLTAQLKLHTLPLLLDTCDENIVHNVDNIRNFSDKITPVPPDEKVVLYLRWLQERAPEQMLALSAYIRHLVQIAVAKNANTSVQGNTPLVELVKQMEVLTRQQRVGGQLFKTEPTFAGCCVEQLLFLSALTWQSSLDNDRFCNPIENEDEVIQVLKDMNRELLWDLFRAVATYGQFNTSRTDVNPEELLLYFLDINDNDDDDDDDNNPYHEILDDIAINQVGTFWKLLSKEFWNRDFSAEIDQRFTAPSISDVFRACAEAEAVTQQQLPLPKLNIAAAAKHATAPTGDGSLTEREKEAERHFDAVPRENDDDNVDIEKLWPFLINT